MGMTHSTHAMKTSSARFNTRSGAYTFCHARMALADTTGVFAMSCAAGVSVPTVRVMSMQRGLARTVRCTNNLTEFEAVVVCNFTPPFTSFELPCDGVEALARCFGEQIGLL